MFPARYVSVKQESPAFRHGEVQILKCADGTLYTGITNDLSKRLLTHNKGKGAKYTRTRLPVVLESFLDGLTKSEALKLEYKIKQLPKNKKKLYLDNLKNNDILD